MIDERDVFEKSFRRYELEGGSFERLVRRRNRKRRNHRIAAGIVGLSVFVSGVGVVATGLPFNRTEAPVVPRAGLCGIIVPPGFQQGEARSWLELTHLGDRIRVRFEVHRSAPGHRWNIQIFRRVAGGREYLVFHGNSVASDGGDFVVQRSYLDNNRDGFRVRAQERQTDQVCEASDWIG